MAIVSRLVIKKQQLAKLNPHNVKNMTANRQESANIKDKTSAKLVFRSTKREVQAPKSAGISVFTKDLSMQ